MPLIKERSKQKSKAQDLRRVRMYFSQTKWLLMVPFCSDLKIYFKEDESGKTIELSTALTSKTQKCLHQIRKHRKLAQELVKEDIDTWLSSMSEKLDNFKLLNKVEVPNISGLLKSKSKKSIDILLPFLEVEAQCIYEEKSTVSSYLFKHGDRSIVPIEKYIFEPHHSTESKALACLILGALHRESSKNILPELKRLERFKWLIECYNYGKKSRLPSRMVVATRLLEYKDGKEFVKKAEHFLKAKLEIKLSGNQVQLMLASGFQPKDLTDLFKSIQTLDSMFHALKDIEEILPAGSNKNKVRKREKIEAKHIAQYQSLRQNIISWIIESMDKNSAIQLQELIGGILLFNATNNSNTKIIADILKIGFSLKPTERTDWLTIIINSLDDLFATEKSRNKSHSVLVHRFSSYNHTKLLECSKIFKIVKDVDITCDIMKFWASSELLNQNISDVNLIKQINRWCHKINVNRMYRLDGFIQCAKSYGTHIKAKRNLDKLIAFISTIRQEKREHIFSTVFEYLNKQKYRNTDTKILCQFLPDLAATIIESDTKHCPCWFIAQTTFDIVNSNYEDKRSLVEALIQLYNQNKPFTYEQYVSVGYGVELALQVLELLEDKIVLEEYAKCKKIDSDHVSLFKKILFSFYVTSIDTNRDNDGSDFRNDGLKELSNRPEILLLNISRLKTSPRQVINLVENLGIINRFDLSSKKRLNNLKRFLKIELNPNSTKTMVAKKWKTIIDRVPDLKPLVLSFIAARSITGEEKTPPPSIAKILLTKETLIGELEYLKGFSGEEIQPHSIKTRIQNLEDRIKDQADIDKNIEARLKRHLYHITEEAEQAAINFTIKEAYKYQLKKITGEAPENIQFDSYLRNALLLTQDVYQNKRLLKRLIRSSIREEGDFRFDIQGNKIFLDFLKDAKIDQATWLGAHPKNYKTKEIPGRKVHIKLECDPIKILEMGNYFDTCLSFGGFNSFATITNACDLNKRVLYAFDNRGNVIGRKLIAINMEGELVGFNTYTSVETKEGRIELRKLITKHIKEFAKKCGLKLSNQGEVAALSSKHWYDDGITKWSSKPKNLSSKKSKSSNRIIH